MYMQFVQKEDGGNLRHLSAALVSHSLLAFILYIWRGPAWCAGQSQVGCGDGMGSGVQSWLSVSMHAVQGLHVGGCARCLCCQDFPLKINVLIIGGYYRGLVLCPDALLVLKCVGR
jgi:hypothetical protein